MKRNKVQGNPIDPNYVDYKAFRAEKEPKGGREIEEGEPEFVGAKAQLQVFELDPLNLLVSQIVKKGVLLVDHETREAVGHEGTNEETGEGTSLQ